MKTWNLMVAGLLLGAAGCAHKQEAPPPRYAEYPPSFYSSPTYSPFTSGGAAAASSLSTTPSGMGDADNEMVIQVRRNLIEDSSIAPVLPSVQILADSGRITLMGTVADQDQKENIESKVRQIAGVTSVDNQLWVSGVASAGAASAGALSATSGANEANKSDANNIVIYTQSVSAGTNSPGVSQMDSTTQQLQPTSTPGSQPPGTAAAIESLQPGAVGGFNVTVESTSVSDYTLARQIVQELKTDTALAVPASQIHISLMEGKVTLSGSVQNEQQKRDIESAVQRVTGVSSVDNQLQIKAAQ